MSFEQILSLCSVLGLSTLINFFVQRHFSRKDEATRQHIKAQNDEQAERDRKREKAEQKKEKDLLKLTEQVNLGLETMRLLSYARVAEEADRLVSKGFATPNERAYLAKLYENYKKWGWNGDMEERMYMVHKLPPYPVF